ncbi:PAS domain S-box protein [Methylobacterium terricola]|uniref:Blue-light-activated histidine kinase n=1 Tax=Methylobacterium terricola TaxID=2583531 RepID=A0A5C4L682_9HYPH|nr:PAS domain-containing protein [Methylobacterium terricola]TNC05169.1 PAS domain S-box protein [Methylobacterium terricola]
MMPTRPSQQNTSTRTSHQQSPGEQQLPASLEELAAENARLRMFLDESEQSAERGRLLFAEARAEQARLEIELSRSRDDLQLLTTAIPQLVWRSHDEGRWTSGSPQWQAYTGQTDPRSTGRGWLDIVHPDDRDHTMQAWHAARARGELAVEHRLRRESDGTYRWFQTRAVPRRETAGAIQEWFGISTEIHELKALQDRQGILLAELQQQARKALAGIRSLVRHSAEPHSSSADYVAHLDGRLNAFARVVSAVARDPSGGIALGGLITDELLACVGAQDDRVRVAGPHLLLQSKAAEVFGLAVHELATNALKYGALATNRGQVQISWRVEDNEGAPQLVLMWRESRLSQPIAPPAHRGFGLTMLESTLPRELHAQTTVDFASDGLICTMILPFERSVYAASAQV